MRRVVDYMDLERMGSGRWILRGRGMVGKSGDLKPGYLGVGK